LTGGATEPPSDLDGIDHSLIGVRDLEAAKRAWQGLGFTVTPRGRHIGWGTANYCSMFERGYVELLGILDPAQFTNDLDKFLADREGLLGLAFASADARSTAGRLAAAGLHPDGPKDLKRLLELPEGDRLPAFKLVYLPAAELPDLRAFFCQHLTPELVRRPEWLVHANSAKRLVALTVASDRPAELAPAYGRIFGATAVKQDGESLTIATGSSEVRFMTPAALASRYRGVAIPTHKRPWMAVQTVGVADLGRTAEVLRRNGQRPVEGDGRLLIDPKAAMGCLLEFVGD